MISKELFEGPVGDYCIARNTIKCLLQMCYHDIEDEEHFLTSEERQSLVYAILMNLRAQQGEVVGAITFLEGQAIGGGKTELCCWHCLICI